MGLIVELRRKTEALLTGFSFSFFFLGGIPVNAGEIFIYIHIWSSMLQVQLL